MAPECGGRWVLAVGTRLGCLGRILCFFGEKSEKNGFIPEF